MNSYRIDTFEMDDGWWKAVVYKCGAFIAERESTTEAVAVELAANALANRIKSELAK